MNKFLSTLACALLASSAWAQTTAGTPPIGQAVSGNNTTAAGVSGTGLRTDGTANTRSKHGDTGRQAAGVDRAGRVVGKSTAVINPARGKADNVNAQATNTTAPDSTAADAPATGGRGAPGTKAETEVMKANARAVKDVPGSRMKTESSSRATEKKRAESKRKGAAKAAARAHGTDGSGS
ncbi:hypothetical protein [Massilia sp. Root335]|jgi:hypothetical protein|uniref:hypothetical protein n=1 Tax=Massilia sp. Root335 TaxID=1736517 RepID=UPI0006FE3C97|nr:hypothetical protein [Massilia sp. Root335]KQV32832.1 hypothetical protein ASC93_03235 [Massilia sp. Root335]